MGRLGVVKVMSLSSFALVVGGLPGVHGAKKAQRRYAGRLIEIRRMETRTVIMPAV